jgi:AraC family transcriptional regulator of adaptative response/methylated-DNA-[protein]-cysteine methyltransferase
MCQVPSYTGIATSAAPLTARVQADAFRMERAHRRAYTGRMETDSASTAVAAAARAIDAAVATGSHPPALTELALLAHVSASTLRRAFVAATGLTPHAYADAARAGRLRDSLSEGAPVSDAIHAAGFGSTSRVYERTDALIGMTPAALRKGAPGETMAYAFTDTSLGRIVVVTTARGVAMIAFGPGDDDLLAAARRRFPLARLAPADDLRVAWVETVVTLAEHPGEPTDLPLDVRGTAFQQRVWTALRRLPAGETVTYAQLARSIGRRTAARAVAQACGANPLALAIPCHRVVGADGSLTGYRWGVERKRALLERERPARR